MKKNHLLSFVLSVTMVCGLVLPFSAASATSVDDYTVNARSAILVDTNNHEILYEHNSHERTFPASITKVMTGLLTIEAIERGELSLDQEITVSGHVNDGMQAGASTQNLKPGEVLRLEDVLYCALIPSANEACNVLAETVSGSISAFVELMNQRAAELGCKDTHFVNPHGLHDENHYTTAYDIYLFSNEAMKHDIFRTVVSSMEHTVPATNISPERHFWDTNALLTSWKYKGYTYQYATGIKTGYTPEAGYCLSSSATKGDRSLIAVVTGCERPQGATGSDGYTHFSESKRLLEWGFSNFSRRTIMDATVPLLDIPVTLSDTTHVVAQPSGSIEATLPNDLDVNSFERKIESYQESIEAPVEKGAVLGKVTLSYDGKEYGSLDLVAVDSVSRNELLYRLDRIQKFFGQLWVKILLVVLILAVLFLVLRFAVFGRRRTSRYGGRSRSRYSGRRRR